MAVNGSTYFGALRLLINNQTLCQTPVKLFVKRSNTRQTIKQLI